MLRLQQAADEGDARCQCDFGLFLLRERRDGSAAALSAKYFEMAADQGIVEAQFQFAFCLEFGTGGRIDVGRAV
jgi:TPR repeat protein